jgi:hypothetical protein
MHFRSYQCIQMSELWRFHLLQDSQRWLWKCDHSSLVPWDDSAWPCAQQAASKITHMQCLLYSMSSMLWQRHSPVLGSFWYQNDGALQPGCVPVLEPVTCISVFSGARYVRTQSFAEQFEERQVTYLQYYYYARTGPVLRWRRISSCSRIPQEITRLSCSSGTSVTDWLLYTTFKLHFWKYALQ